MALRALAMSQSCPVCLLGRLTALHSTEGARGPGHPALECRHFVSEQVLSDCRTQVELG